jgi:protein-histidine pros-kinase
MDLQYETWAQAPSRDASIAVGAAGTVLYWSKGAERVYGYPALEAVGRNFFSLIVPDSAITQAHEQFAGALQGNGEPVELLRRCKDGSLRHVCSSTERHEGDAEACLLFTEKDVTTLQLSRYAAQVESTCRNVLDSLPDGILLTDVSGHIVFANARAERMFDHDPGALCGVNSLQLLPAANRVTGGNYLIEARGRQAGAVERIGLRRNGTEFPLEVSISPLQLDSAALTMSVVRDLSDRKKAEMKFRGLLDAAPDALVLANPRGEIVLVNTQTERLFGYTRGELLGQLVERLLPDRLHRQHARHREHFAYQPHARPMGAGQDLWGRRKDGTEFPVEICLSPIQFEEGVLVSASIRDASPRRRIEQQLRDQNVQLERANHAKDHFLASMSHELRTPLNAVIGFAGTLLMKLPGPLNADQEKQLRTIQSSGRHLLSLINDLLDVATIGAGKAELDAAPVDCGELLVEVVDTLRLQAQEKQIQLDLHRPATPVILQVDRRALTQIVMNLIDNAIKYTPSGRVEVSLSCSQTDEGALTRISVQDTGPGISAEDQARLFEPFARLHQRSGSAVGTGLGLYLSATLAALIGGRINLASAPDQGSTFTLLLKS